MLMDKLSFQCEVCKGCIVVTEEIFMEIEKEESQETENGEPFKFSKFCQFCNNQEGNEESSEELTKENFEFRR